MLNNESSRHIYFSKILIDSVFEIEKNYHPQVFLRRLQIPYQRKDGKILDNDYELLTSSNEDTSGEGDSNKE